MWEHREDIIAAKPFLFTLDPGQNSSTYTLTPYTGDTLSPNKGKKLAYSEGDLNLPVNYGVISAFIITNGGNTDTQVVDAWTIERDQYGRNLLGVAQFPKGFPRGRDWTMQACAWNGDYCDGYYFLNCGACFGLPAVIEIVEYKE